MNATKTVREVAEEIRQAFRDGSLAQKASMMIRERGVDREEAERQILNDMINQIDR
jgi:hypothetical protein